MCARIFALGARKRLLTAMNQLVPFQVAEQVNDRRSQYFQFIIVCLQVQNIASSEQGQVEAKEATISKILKAGEKNTSALQPLALRRKEFSVKGASC